MTEENKPESTIIDVHTVEQAAILLDEWLTTVKQTLTHMSNIPEGTIVENEDTKDPVKLSGDVLIAFKTGLDVAIALLEESPFSVVTEEEPIDEPVQP